MKHPPYHLRPNKAIDRMMLVNAIDILRQHLDLSEHTYFGFGGPFLDDIRVLSQFFPKMAFVSIEKNAATHKRQNFHRNTKNLTLVHNDINSYLKQEFPSGAKSVFWLDYTDLRPDRIEEFMEVLQIVGDGSLVKITLRAEFDRDGLESAERLLNVSLSKLLRDAWMQEFERNFGDYLPPDRIAADLESSKFAELLQQMLQIAAQSALPAETGRVFQLIHSCRYTDGCEMLSITGVVCNDEDCNSIVDHFRSWNLSNTDWRRPDHIDVPHLSVKERLFLERFLPTSKGTGKGLQRNLGYNIDRSGAVSQGKLQQYERFYSYYPQFVKVNV